MLSPRYVGPSGSFVDCGTTHRDGRVSRRDPGLKYVTVGPVLRQHSVESVSYDPTTPERAKWCRVFFWYKIGVKPTTKQGNNSRFVSKIRIIDLSFYLLC